MDESSYEQLTDLEDTFDDDDAIEDQPPCKSKKRRGAARIWTKVEEFASREAAFEFIKKENTWTVACEFDTKDVVKRQYRCNKVKRSGPQCPAALYILCHSDTNFNIIHAFMPKLTILQKWSKERAPINAEYKAFIETPTKTTAVWTSAYQWSTLDNKKIKTKPFDDGRRRDFYIPAGDYDVLTPGFINGYRTAFTNLIWQSFEHYAAMRNSMWIVSVTADEYESSSCNCPVFLKKYICKHSVGLAIKKKVFEVPLIASTIPIGQKRPRGRPSLASAALIID